MFNNRNKSANYGDIQSGQTLFDFLKRKKKFALETSLSKSRKKDSTKQNINLNSNVKQGNQKYHQSAISPHKKYEQTYRETLRQSRAYPSIGKNNQETHRSMVCTNLNATTPKRVSFLDEKEKKPTARSSFIEMISPLKRRNSKTPQHCATAKQSSIIRDYEKPKPTPNPQQLFYRKNLNSSISTLKSTLQKFMSTSAAIKEKSHSLFVQLKPLLKIVEQSSNINFAKRAEEAKLKLRSFQHLFKQFAIENGNQILEQFQRSFSQHLISLESNIRSTFEKDKLEEYKRIKQQKDSKIQELTTNKDKMSKQIDILNRRIQKMERQNDKFKLSSSHIIQKGEHNYNSKITQLETKIEQYELEINSLAKQLDASKQSEKALHKTVKDLKYLKEEAERRFIEQNIRVKSTKEQFLLNQISILKKEFKNDMEQLTLLYSTKQRQHVAIIEELKLQNSQLIKQIGCQKQVESKILSDAVTSRGHADKLKKQNDCLVTDLHRMNEELYQHWLALKDIKTLAVRLQIFNKFSKIYEDVAFNDQLFI